MYSDKRNYFINYSYNIKHLNSHVIHKKKNYNTYIMFICNC